MLLCEHVLNHCGMFLIESIPCTYVHITHARMLMTVLFALSDVYVGESTEGYVLTYWMTGQKAVREQ